MTRDRDRETGAADGEDPFLARWSRRKRAAGAPDGPPDEGASAADPGETADPPAADARGDDAAAPEDGDLPPPESLGPDSDFSAYLSRRVSGGLRRAAMRRLFSLSDFNVRDGLDDYDEDYTQFAALGDTVTADMRYHEERRRARDEAAQAEAGDADDTEGEPGATTAEPDDGVAAAPDATPDADAATDRDAIDEDPDDTT